MDSFELEPGYSTKEIPGKCLKCLAEHELNNCLMLLLREEGEDEDYDGEDEDEDMPSGEDMDMM